MLNSHPDIDWKSELFHPVHEKEMSPAELGDPFEFIQSAAVGSAKRTFGFETKFQHLDSNGLDIDFGVFLFRLNAIGFTKFILLERKNYLRQAISVARGQLTKTWHVSEKDAKPNFQPFQFDVDQVGLGGKNRSLIECFKFLESYYQIVLEIFQQCGMEFLHLKYEDDLEGDATIGFSKAICYLDLPTASVTASLQRLDNRSVAEMISNFDEVCGILRGTHFEWMCKE